MQKNNRTLYLTLQKKWFDMILDGEKREEYRDIKKYYWSRLLKEPYNHLGKSVADLKNLIASGSNIFKDFDTVTFRNGYAADSPEITVHLCSIEIKTGLNAWGAAPDREYFTLILGDVITSKNIKAA